MKKRNHGVVPLCLGGMMLGACSVTGMTHGQQGPGATTSLDPGIPLLDGSVAPPGTSQTGAIAVDPVSENVFVVQTTVTGVPNDAGILPSRSTLFTSPPNASTALPVADLSGLSGEQLLFPPGELLLIANDGFAAQMRRIDAHTFSELQRSDGVALIDSPRLSSSGNFVLTQPGFFGRATIVDTHTLEEQPFGAGVSAAVWLHGTDRMIAITFASGCANDPSGACPNPLHVSIQSWSVPVLASAGYPRDAMRRFAAPDHVIDAPDAGEPANFSADWVGVSADDHFVVIPMQSSSVGIAANLRPGLLIVDTTTWTVRPFAGAVGPVGFTPDGSTIVAYQPAVDDSSGVPTTPANVLLINANTLMSQPFPLPISGDPLFFVAREGDEIIVTPSAPFSGGVGFLDTRTRRLSWEPADSLSLNDFVSRVGHNEMWLLSGGLERLNVITGVLEDIALPFAPSAINILPNHDTLVLGESDGNHIDFFDPTALMITHHITLGM